MIQEILYDPFGGIIEDTNPGLRIPVGYAGGLHDRDLNFVRFGWRDYDVNTSRWTAPDPLGDKGGDSDWYGYCLDDPVNAVDPLGLFRFGKRPLGLLPDSAHWIGTDGSTADAGNYELKDEHGFFEDGTNAPPKSYYEKTLSYPHTHCHMHMANMALKLFCGQFQSRNFLSSNICRKF
nr:RHS repeat-associated core domain-containing protein [uncultured Pseudodesulfovibrio sp.]